MKTIPRCLCLAAGLAAGAAAAADLTLAGIMGGRALITVAGASRLYSVGQNAGAYRLVVVENEHIVVESAGRQQRIRIGQRAIGHAGDEETATIHRDVRGHFAGSGSINDRPVRFLVDTGATTVAMGLSQARRLGLDRLPGRRGAAQTANGPIETTCVRLDKVSLGDINLDGVVACYSDKEMPEILLGMSFLERTEMKVDGPLLRLKKRY